MGRSPCCSSSSSDDDDDANMKKGPWTPEEDQKLIHCINKHGHGNWKSLSKQAGLNRCGKSCRLRWTNYLRPDIKRGRFSEEEERIIVNLHSTLGNKWSKIATYLPGRTDNEIKNFWNTHMRKKLQKPRTHHDDDLNQLLNLSQMICAAQLSNLMNPLQNLIQTLNTVGLMGSTSRSFYPFEGLVNSTSSLYADHEQAQIHHQKFQCDHEGSIMSQTLSDQSRDVSDSVTDNLVSATVSKSPETTSSMSQAWEKLMDDDSSSSCWKDILD